MEIVGIVTLIIKPIVYSALSTRQLLLILGIMLLQSHNLQYTFPVLHITQTLLLTAPVACYIPTFPVLQITQTLFLTAPVACYIQTFPVLQITQTLFLTAPVACYIPTFPVLHITQTLFLTAPVTCYIQPSLCYRLHFSSQLL